MKKVLLLLAFTLFIDTNIVAQCLPNGISFSSQEEIDNFSTNNPGCTEIEGYVQISGENINNLDGLAQITKIDKYLDISMCPLLTSLNGLNNIDTILGNLSIGNQVNFMNLAGLTALSFIGGDLQFNQTESLVTLEGLNNLKTIGGDFHTDFPLQENYGFQGLNNLTSIGGDFTIDNAEQLVNFQGLNSLTTIGGLLSIPIASKLVSFEGLNNLKTIEGEFEIPTSLLIKSFQGLNSLEYVKGNFFSLLSLSKFDNFSGLESLKYIDGDFELIQFPKANNFSGLENLEEISGNFFFSTPPSNFSDFSGLNSLHKIGGNFQLDLFNGSLEGLGQLDTIGGNFQIDDSGTTLLSFQHINNLKYIGGRLVLFETKLKNLSGLEHLKSLGGLSLFSNQLLTSLIGLQNVIEVTNNLIEITDNPLLTQCAMNFLCLNFNETTIVNNAIGCNSLADIQCNEFGISGYVYYDTNQNQTKDSSEFGLQNQSIIFNNTDINLTNTNGRYFQVCDSGSVYDISWQPNEEWTLTTEPSFSMQFFPNTMDAQDKNFGIVFSGDKHEAIINLTIGSSRCNTIVPFYLRCQNTGSYIENGNFVVHYDSLCSYSSFSGSANVTIDSAEHSITWPYNSLSPFETRDFVLYLKMPDENSTGDLLNFNAAVFHDMLLLTSSGLRTEVLCSFDPNDKNVNPSGERAEHYTLHDQKLTYTVRFQNTGNAEAIDIRILDTLDSNLDINTFRVVNSSFPVNTTIKDQKLEFYFQNIWLPDSTHNEPLSHGFITYEVSPISGLSDYTAIKNTAHIIFDFNPPVVTNTAFNLMVTTIPVGTQEVNKTPIFIRPNPASSTIEISALAGQKINAISIYDPIGRLLLTQKETIVNISNFPKGIYFVKVNIGDLTGIQKLVVE